MNQNPPPIQQRKRIRLSLSARINLSVLILLTALLGIGGVLGFHFERNRRYAALADAVDAAAHRIATGSVEPVWNMDNDLAAHMIRAEMSMPALRTVGVFSGNAPERMRPFAILHREPGGVDAPEAEGARGGGAKESGVAGEGASSTEGLRELKVWPEGAAPWRGMEVEIHRNGRLIGMVRIGAADDLLRRELRELLYLIVGLVLLVDAVLLFALSVLLRRLVIRPLLEGVTLSRRMSERNCILTNAVETIAGGDLAQAIDLPEDGTGGGMERACLARSDEIGSLFRSLDDIAVRQRDLVAALRTMNGAMGHSLNQVVEASAEVGQSAQQIAETSEHLSEGAAQSAASLEEITASMTEISARTRQNAESAQLASDLATAARTAAESGNARMDEMVDAITDIKTSSQEISRIMKVIDDIAFQTNLLALNAAVEAARAGRHGKGFAVVADEVRSLAGRSAKAAGETAALIEASGIKVENGTDIAHQTASVLGEIVTGITKAAELVQEIAQTSTDQAEGVNQISIGLDQINNVTQNNTANAEATAAAAEELTRQAHTLRELLARFRLSDDAPVLPASGRRSGAPELSLGDGEVPEWAGRGASGTLDRSRRAQLHLPMGG